LFASAAEHVVLAANEAVSARGRFTIALSGGSTPKSLYNLLATKALDLFIAVFGAEASNLALKTMATGGLFLAGGISPKILAKLKGPSFMRSFLDKGRMRALVEAMPVHVVTNEKVGLLGAARCGALRARG
jgi:glucokinase